MKKHLIFFVLLLSAFSIHAEGIKLACSSYQPTCTNCSEYQTLFPIEEFSKDSGSLDIEADQSEILNESYHLTGDVKVKSSSIVLAADDVLVNSADDSTVATGNVRFQDQTYLITSDSLSANRDGNLTLPVATVELSAELTSTSSAARTMDEDLTSTSPVRWYVSFNISL